MPIPFLKEVLTLLDYKLITNSSFETGVFPSALNTLWCNHLSKPDNDPSDFNYCRLTPLFIKVLEQVVIYSHSLTVGGNNAV